MDGSEKCSHHLHMEDKPRCVPMHICSKYYKNLHEISHHKIAQCVHYMINNNLRGPRKNSISEGVLIKKHLKFPTNFRTISVWISRIKIKIAVCDQKLLT